MASQSLSRYATELCLHHCRNSWDLCWLICGSSLCFTGSCSMHTIASRTTAHSWLIATRSKAQQWESRSPDFILLFKFIVGNLASLHFCNFIVCLYPLKHPYEGFSGNSIKPIDRLGKKSTWCISSDLWYVSLSIFFEGFFDFLCYFICCSLQMCYT